MSVSEKLKQNFIKIKTTRLNIKNKFTEFEATIKAITAVYTNYITSEKSVFGIDSLHFQNAYIQTEKDNLNKLYLLIDNKIYCEYYKLLNLIVKDAKNTNNPNKKIEKITSLLEKYPIYKDLEPLKQYNFNIIDDIHQELLNCIDILNNILLEKQSKLITDKRVSSQGLNIDNYISTCEFDSNILRERIKLYSNYLTIYHRYHLSYLNNFNGKLTTVIEQLNTDITINASPTNLPADDNDDNNSENEHIETESVDSNIS
tara:strand:- start:580 stop:1356 length:777 start_codon:yes stop_codon:yes gene_type:complete